MYTFTLFEMLQYCEKVMQTINIEYRALLRYINDISAIYHTYKRRVAKIIQQDIGAPLRYLADISFLRYISTALNIVQRATDSLRYKFSPAAYRYSDIS